MASVGVVRSTALRAGGACVRCRKGKTKCVYENGRAPCKNCAKGLHDCYLPSESMAAGSSPARHTAVHRPARESLPAVADPRAPSLHAPAQRIGQIGTPDKLTADMISECERIVSRTYPACVAFHKPTFITHLKNSSIESSLLYALLCSAARSSPGLIRRYGASQGNVTPTHAAEHFAQKTMTIINSNLDAPSLGDIQAMCLIIIHEWGSRQAVRAYIYLGQAARMVQMYRVMHSHHSDPAGENFLQEESFRRALWLLYILDCLLTSHPGRQPALSASDIADVSLPCSDMNFAFGNAVVVETLARTTPSRRSPDAPVDIVGEFGQIIRATRIWREVVHMLMSGTMDTFSEATCVDLMNSIEDLRRELPMQFIDKPGQINLHITMGSGFTYAMLHCMLHCSSIFITRRRLLQYVTAPNFNLESWRHTPQCHEVIDRLLTSCHSTISMLIALDAAFDKESIPCFPVVMLFSAFTASATVAYLSLKTLTPPNAVETAGHIVRDGLRFMQEGVETWPLISSWLRHLSVMQRVLVSDRNGTRSGSADHMNASSIKDDASNAESNNPDAMEFDHGSNSGQGLNPLPNPTGGSTGESGRESEPPAPRRPGVTTINGGSGAVGTPNTTSPPPGQPDIKRSPESVAAPLPSNGSHEPMPERAASVAPQVQDMTAVELCTAFERQLLELDDLAAFMGGGV